MAEEDLDLDLDLDSDFDVDLDAEVPQAKSTPPSPVKPKADVLFTGDEDEDNDDGLESFMDNMDLKVDGSGTDLSKPWMRYHEFKLVKQIADVRKIIDACIEHGSCALDLETEGFDNRIEYDAQGQPYTRHKIVGYCLGLKGQGYYIPVRHRWEALYDKRGPNVDDIVGTEKEIKRLCLASQPVLDPEAAKYDPLGAKEFLEPPKVTIKFWHSKFDQEFLYPVTGIDWWHPDSFEDGMLASYVIYTDGVQGLKDNAFENLSVKDIETGADLPYEMINFNDLFPKSIKPKERAFYKLSPSEDGEGWNCVLYGCSDGICTDLLCDKLCPEAKAKKYKGFYRLEKQVVQAVRIMERCRVQINKDEIVSLLAEAEKELENYEKRIIKVAMENGFDDAFNPSSSAQLADLLFGTGHLDIADKPEKTTEGQFKTDEKTLEAYLDKPGCPDVISWIIKHRQINKVKGTYLENLANNTDELGQLRLNFRQTGAATGRFTAPKGDADHGFAGVPIQGIPAKNDPKKPQVAHSLRRMFVAREGYVLAKVDYASQELRIAASVSGEEKWINEYVKELETGLPADLHAMTAMAFFPGLKESDPDFKLKRGMGKTANFALVYGGGVGAVQRATGCDPVEGGRLLKAFHESVPHFSKWVDKQHETVKGQLGVRTGFGRFISIPDAKITADEIIKSDMARQEKARLKDPSIQVKQMGKGAAWKDAKRIQAACERKSTNYPIQGSGADILKLSLVFLIKEFHIRGWLKNGGDDSVRLVMTVHDEIVFEIKRERVAEAIPVLKKIMEYPSTLARWTVPLIAEPELGDSWNAKLDWISMLSGDEKHPVPEWLRGQTIDPDPEVFVLTKVGKPGSQPQNEVPKKTVTLEATPEKAPKVEKSKAPEGASSEADSDDLGLSEEDLQAPESSVRTIPVPEKPMTNHTQYAVFHIASTYLTDSMVAGVYQAIESAKAEAFRLGKMPERIPIELLDGYGNVLVDHKDGVLAYPPEFGRKLRETNLGREEFELLDV